jgi:hypothetical protein
MLDKQSFSHNRLGPRLVRLALILVLIGIGFDYGKHIFLKRILEKEMSQSQGLVSVQSIIVEWWPLFDNHLIIKDFKVNLSGTPIAAQTVRIRQGWRDWNEAFIKAVDVQSNDTVTIQEAQGRLDIKDLYNRIKVSDLILRNVNVKLPLLSFSGTQASFDFLYDLATHHLSLKADAPEMTFPNGASFGLNGEGEIHTNPPMKGDMNVKIKNIDKMLKELVAVGVINESQAGLVISGSNFLDKIGFHDITLPLKIENGDVSLGPVLLFKVGKKEAKDSPLQ